GVIMGLTFHPIFGAFGGLIIFGGIGLKCWSNRPIVTGAIGGAILTGLIELINWTMHGPNDNLTLVVYGVVAGSSLGLIGEIVYPCFRLDDIQLENTISYSAIVRWQRNPLREYLGSLLFKHW